MKRILLSLLMSSPFISFAASNLENTRWHTPVTIINSTNGHEIKLSPSKEKCMISNRKDAEIKPDAHYETMVFDHAYNEADCRIKDGKAIFMRQWQITQPGLENTGVLSYINKITAITDKEGVVHETRVVMVKLLNSSTSSPDIFRQTAQLISNSDKVQDIGEGIPITRGDSVEINITNKSNSNLNY